MKNRKRIMIAAPKSGSGKTILTCALLQLLKKRGEQIISYKCGPDFIDPMFHETILEVSSKNLDTFFTKEERTKELFLRDQTEDTFAVLEGVMGLFDGLLGTKEEGSSYHLAKVTKTPILFLVDAKGMGRSIIPLIAGFLAYDKAHLIQGIILNKVSKSYYEILKPLIEEELKVKVAGYIPVSENLHIKSRYLGLVLPNERKKRKEQIQVAAEEIAKTVSLEEIMQIAKAAEELTSQKIVYDGSGKEIMNSSSDKEAFYYYKKEDRFRDKVIIAVAKDEAFCFYYADNLLLLQEYGAEIRYFSPISDKKLPKNCHAVLIGGGYPELYAKQLSQNENMLKAVKYAAESKMPMIAECGGFLYLHSAVRDKNGINYVMAGVIPSVCFDTGKLVRFGYIEIKEKQSYFLPKGETIKGHEFHYYDSLENGEDCFAIKPVTGREYSCVREGSHYWYGFPHLYYPSNPGFAKRFVEMAEKYRDRIGR